MCAYRSVLRREIPNRTSPLELPAVNQAIEKANAELMKYVCLAVWKAAEGAQLGASQP
jgi:hypothetical protein